MNQGIISNGIGLLSQASSLNPPNNFILDTSVPIVSVLEFGLSGTSILQSFNSYDNPLIKSLSLKCPFVPDMILEKQVDAGLVSMKSNIYFTIELSLIGNDNITYASRNFNLFTLNEEVQFDNYLIQSDNRQTIINAVTAGLSYFNISARIYPDLTFYNYVFNTAKMPSGFIGKMPSFVLNARIEHSYNLIGFLIFDAGNDTRNPANYLNIDAGDDTRNINNYTQYSHGG